GAIQSSNRGRQPARRETGEIILEEVGRTARQYAEAKDHTCLKCRSRMATNGKEGSQRGPLSETPGEATAETQRGSLQELLLSDWMASRFEESIRDRSQSALNPVSLRLRGLNSVACFAR